MYSCGDKILINNKTLSIEAPNPFNSVRSRYKIMVSGIHAFHSQLDDFPSTTRDFNLDKQSGRSIHFATQIKHSSPKEV
jgi:hypothetical protein